MSVIDEKKQALEDEYGLFSDPQELFEYLIEKNKNQPHLEAKLKTAENLVKGCVSSLWLVCGYDGDKCVFKSDADSLITRAYAFGNHADGSVGIGACQYFDTSIAQ